MENQIPNLKDLMQYDVNRRGQYEGIRQSLYDFTDYNPGGQTSLQFFQQPRGQAGKTIADTNMSSAGQLPQPQNFLVQSIEILFFPGTAVSSMNEDPDPDQFANDVYQVMKSGSLNLYIGSKTYLEEAPIGRFPPKTNLRVDSAVGFQHPAALAESWYSTTYACAAGRPYYLDPPVLLVPNQNFEITLSWPSPVSLPSSFFARIGVVLDGILYRQSQ